MGLRRRDGTARQHPGRGGAGNLGVSVLVLAGPGGAPGVTTAAVALALMWPRPVILAECDPAGGSIISGLWRGEPGSSATGGLPSVLAAGRDMAAALDTQALLLGGDAEAMLLPAPPGPDAGQRLAGSWPRIASVFASAERDVIADIGRFDGTGGLSPLLGVASQVLMVCRPTRRQAAAAGPRLKLMSFTRPADGIVVISPGRAGHEVFARQLGVAVAGTLPWAPASARVLSDGAWHGRWFIQSRLMRAARRLAGQLARGVDAQPGAQVPPQVWQR
jgi:hypothetical protein